MDQPGRNIILRKARSQDSEFAYNVKKTAFMEYVEQVFGWEENAQRELHERRFASQEFRIIRYNSVDIGIVAYEVQTDCLKLNQLFLLPEYQERGIGEECMKHVMRKARMLNIPIRLRVLKVNQRANEFYQRLGFVYASESDIHVMLEKV